MTKKFLPHFPDTKNLLLQIHAHFFALLGFLPFRFKGCKPYPSLFFRLYNFLLILIYIPCIPVLFNNLPVTAADDLAFKISLICALALWSSSLVSILIVSAIKARNSCELVKTICSVDEELNEIGFKFNTNLWILKCWIFSLPQLISHILVVATEIFFPWWMTLWELMFITYELYNFYFALLLTILIASCNAVTCRMRYINDFMRIRIDKELKFTEPADDGDNKCDLGIHFIKNNRKISPMNAAQNKEEDEYLTRKLNTLQRCHFALCEISNDIASLFSIPIILITLFTFIGLIINLYTGFKWIVFQKKVELYLILTCVKWAVVDVVRILSTVLPFSLLQKEGNQTPILVHGLYLKTKNRKIQKQLQMFSLQLIHHKMNFTTWGLFKLDTSLIVSIAGAVTTYLVIILQFNQPTDSQKPETNS